MRRPQFNCGDIALPGYARQYVSPVVTDLSAVWIIFDANGAGLVQILFAPCNGKACRPHRALWQRRSVQFDRARAVLRLEIHKLPRNLRGVEEMQDPIDFFRANSALALANPYRIVADQPPDC